MKARLLLDRLTANVYGDSDDSPAQTEAVPRLVRSEQSAGHAGGNRQAQQGHVRQLPEQNALGNPRQQARALLRESHGPGPLKPTPKGPFNQKELEMGTDEEGEHTTSRRVARTIAKQHLNPKGKIPPEKQQYYHLLRKYVEPKMKAAERQPPKPKAFLMALPPSQSYASSP